MLSAARNRDGESDQQNASAGLDDPRAHAGPRAKSKADAKDADGAEPLALRRKKAEGVTGEHAKDAAVKQRAGSVDGLSPARSLQGELGSAEAGEAIDDGRAHRADDQAYDRIDCKKMVVVVDGQGGAEADGADDGDVHGGHQAAEGEQGEVHLHVVVRGGVRPSMLARGYGAHLSRLIGASLEMRNDFREFTGHGSVGKARKGVAAPEGVMELVRAADDLPQDRSSRCRFGVRPLRAIVWEEDAAKMNGSYNTHLVLLSVAVAVLSSYTVLDVARRIRRMPTESTRRRWWLLGGAAMMGNGIWSMHFIGMLACNMPMRIEYDPAITALSLLVAIASAYLALRLMTQPKLQSTQLRLGGLLLGMGIASMHMTGMSAMLVRPGPTYRPGLLLAAIGIAFGAAWAALLIAFMLKDSNDVWGMAKRCGAAAVMGCAIAGMHYVGMSSMILSPHAVAIPSKGIGNEMLSVLVPVFAIGGLGVILALAVLNSQFEELMQTTVPGSATMATFLERTESRLAASRPGTRLGLLILDIDAFKIVNDSLGFTAGDELLAAFWQDLLRRVRADTLAARLGGDEFVLLLEGYEESTDIRGTAKSIFERLQQDFSIQGVQLRVTASAGLAIHVEGGTAVTLLKNANVAMRAAKESGKNSFRVFDPLMNDAAGRRVQITRGLSEALTKYQFSLVFQPKFDGRDKRITGAEALIRWCHPQLGNVSPMDFIPLAEETGQIVPISEWVIREVCRLMVAWRNMGLDPVKVAINLSPEQLRLEGYAERISRMVTEAGVDPRWIMFEITETAAMREPKLAMVAITEFQTAGFDFAIDDFGTGYSSMAYLQQFRVKELKIDRFFVSSLEDGAEEGHTIVSAIIALAHALHMTVVAEGVETAAQLKKLNGMDCDEVQGYLLGRPLIPADFEKLLRGAAERDEFAEAGAARPGGQAAPKPRLLSAIA